MGRMAMPDGALTGVTIQGARTGRTKEYRGRIVEVSDPTDAKTLREFGAFDVNLGGATRSGGYVCTACGFQAYFTSCSRCGAVCEKA